LTGDWAVAREHSGRGLALSHSQLALLHARMLLEYETGHVDVAGDYLMKLIEADRCAGPYPLAGIFVGVGIAQALRLESGAVDSKICALARTMLKRRSRIFEVEVAAWIGRALFAIHERDVDECAEALEHLQPLKGLIVMPFLVTDHISGLLARTAGRTERARSNFENALTFCRCAGYRPELAWTCYDYARLLVEGAGPDDREKASALLAEASGIASDLGMRPLAHLVTWFRHRYRARLIRKPAGLTNREIEILHLLVRGKTNKDMAQALDISTNTVAVHVARILRKTGSSNRTEAAAFAHRQHLVGAIGN
jgi:DNA-binding CsgD family transcriptional regulator